MNVEQKTLAAEIDLMRDVYMSRAQREAYERILARALEQPKPRPVWEREPPHCPTCDCGEQPEGREAVAAGEPSAAAMAQAFIERYESRYTPHTVELVMAEVRARARELDTTPPAKVPDGWSSVLAEVERATRKFPTWPTDPLHAVAVLGEEFGELTKAVLQSVYEPHKVDPGEVRTEAIQTAAMALRFLLSLDAYAYTRSEQHAQSLAAAQPAGGGFSPTVDCIGLALDLEQQAGRVESQTVERSMTAAAIGLRRINAELTQTQPEKAMNEHTDDSAIDRFAAAMKAKMAKQREKGYGDWDNPAACPAERLEQCLRESVLKGDPVDVGNFAMMLFNRGQKGDAVAPYNFRSTPNPPTALDLERAGGAVSSVSSVVPTTPENEEGDAAETIERNPKSWEAWRREAERLAALLAERPQAGEVDPALAEFYGVTTVAELLAAQEEHVLKLQDTVRRNVKPWEDTMPPTLLPKYLRDTGLDAAEPKVQTVVVCGATPPESGGQGFVMVPVEPTPEMLRPFAAMAILAQGHDPDEPQPPHGEYPRWYGACSPLAMAYSAMLAAAQSSDNKEADRG